MAPDPDSPERCPVTGIPYRWMLPGGPSGQAQAPTALFFLNGLGLDLDGFQDALQALDLPWALAKYPYRHGCHVALTVPGFEDGAREAPGPLFSMADQGRLVADFMVAFLERHPAREVILYGFSYGSDLAVEVLGFLGNRVPLARVVLTEMNVHLHSCFISSRITEAMVAARGQGQARHREAYKGFVSRVVKASAEGRLSETLMQDMALYFRTIARKDWDQLAQSAEEASDQPEARAARLLGLTADCPGTQFDLVFSDPQDLRLILRRLETWGGHLGRIRVFDTTAQEHFHHMGRAGVLENLGGWARLAATGPAKT